MRPKHVMLQTAQSQRLRRESLSPFPPPVRCLLITGLSGPAAATVGRTSGAANTPFGGGGIDVLDLTVLRVDTLVRRADAICAVDPTAMKIGDLNKLYSDLNNMPEELRKVSTLISAGHRFFSVENLRLLSHERVDFKVVSVDGQHEFALYTRQSTRLKASFSAGIRWLPRGEEGVMLVRCNGSSHEHTNAMEREVIAFQCHVHVATERYLSASKRDEGYAVSTSAYNDLPGALLHLIDMCNIMGFNEDAGPQLDMFDHGHET